MKEIYLDNAATTPLRKEVLQEMLPYLTEEYGNPSALYRSAQRARGAVAAARSAVAEVIGARPDEIYFTSGGTEADNWALKAVYEAFGDKKPQIITSRIEHHAILETCHYLEKHGAQVIYLPVERSGRIDIEKIANAVTDKTCLISVMTANNETGIIQPVREIGKIAKEKQVLFHTDAVQAYGHIPLSVGETGADLMSISAHKIGGPKGCGALYIRKGVHIQSFMHGGLQEHARRAGTENVAGIVGFGKAARLAMTQEKEVNRKIEENRDYLAGRILNEIPDTSLNGDRKSVV